MDGDKIKKKLLNYARDYAFEKISKTLDKKMANNTNENYPQNSDPNEDEPLRSSIGGRPHTVSCKRMTPRLSRPLGQADRRSTLEDEVVFRRRPRVHLTRDQRDRFSRVRSDGDSCLEGDEGDEEDDLSPDLMSRTKGKLRGSVASMQKPNPRASIVYPLSKIRSERASGCLTRSSNAPHMIKLLGK